jgi:FdhE protein
MTQVGQPHFDPIPIGEVVKPPFVRLPDPASMFSRRAQRLRSLAEGHDLGAYLRFVADVSDVQHRLHSLRPPPEPPTTADLARARQFKLPPLARSRFVRDAAFDALWDGFLSAMEPTSMPAGAREALARMRAADSNTQAALVADVLKDTMPVESLAEHAFVAAIAQVHFARLASQIDAKTLMPVGDGACPTCGAPPLCSMVVGWSGAENTRFCACSMCGTLWNYPRVNCTLCGSTEGIAYQEITHGLAAAKAETCDACGRYVKVLQQRDQRSVDPVADDIATLGLDLLLRQSEYRRGAVNHFLLGY